MVSMSMSAEAARRALEDAKGDDDFVRRYLDGDAAAFRHMQGLLQAAYPDDSSIDLGKATRDDADLAGPEPAGKAPAPPSGDGGGSALSDWLLEAGDAGFAPPKSPSHYQLDYAPNVEIDPDFDGMARDWMYRAELPAGWAGEIARDYQRRAAKPPSADEVAQEREAVLGRLRKDWGDAADAKLAQVRGLIGGIGDDRLTETLDRSGLGNNEWLIRQLAILADRKAATAAERKASQGSEESESNGETDATDRVIKHQVAWGTDNNSVDDLRVNPGSFIQLGDKSNSGAIGETVGPELTTSEGTASGGTDEAQNDSHASSQDLVVVDGEIDESTALGRIVRQIFEAGRREFDEPLGIGAETWRFLVYHGFFRSGSEGYFNPMTPIRAFNETLLNGGAQAINLLSRISSAIGSMSVAGMVQIAREAGASETEARQLERDLTMLSEIVAIATAQGIGTVPEAGLGRRMAARSAERRAGDFAQSVARASRSFSPPLFRKWVEGVAAAGEERGQSALVGRLGEKLKDQLQKRQIQISTDEITIGDRQILHMLRDAKKAGVPEEYIRDLPKMLQNARAVLLDTRNGRLLFVFDVIDDPRKGKFVVALDYADSRRTLGGKRGVTTNRVISGGLVAEPNLTGPQYDLLVGQL
jgi:hypothetical protein